MSAQAGTAPTTVDVPFGLFVGNRFALWMKHFHGRDITVPHPERRVMGYEFPDDTMGGTIPEVITVTEHVQSATGTVVQTAFNMPRIYLFDTPEEESECTDFEAAKAFLTERNSIDISGVTGTETPKLKEPGMFRRILAALYSHRR